MEAIKLAAQSQRIMDDLYYGESRPTPLEELMDAEDDEQEDENDGFEEAESEE